MALLIYQPPQDPYLRILYRDDDLLALDKPSGLLSVPGKEIQHRDSLKIRVQRVYPSATVVHRLDMATSGIMLMALNKQAHRELSRQFENRETAKRYIARVYGNPAQLTGEVAAPLICDWPNRPMQKIDWENGKNARTKYSVLNQGTDEALVMLEPITGRSHQLRVHCLHLGHPIVGDKLYAHQKAFAMADRLQLHAESLKITHPTTGKVMIFRSACPFAEIDLPALE